jgi:ketosteroid isomerase-like protein
LPKEKMMRTLLIATMMGSAVLALGLGHAARPQERAADRPGALASLIEAELSFSKMSEERGIREAFLTWLAPSSVVFRPEPVPGPTTYRKVDPLDPAVLTWEPEVAEVSASGDFGYTSGPYVYRPGRRMEPTAFGHYVSVWIKRLDGSWKVVCDIGVTYPESARPARSAEVATPGADKGAGVLSPQQQRDAEKAFVEATSSYIREAALRGLRKVLNRSGTDDIRIYRPGRAPTVGKAQISRSVRGYAGRIMAIDPDNKANGFVSVARSGDLAYSYGSTFFYDTPRHQAKLVFFRIWRKQPSGEWKVCLDVELPASSPS